MEYQLAKCLVCKHPQGLTHSQEDLEGGGQRVSENQGARWAASKGEKVECWSQSSPRSPQIGLMQLPFSPPSGSSSSHHTSAGLGNDYILNVYQVPHSRPPGRHREPNHQEVAICQWQSLWNRLWASLF